MNLNSDIKEDKVVKVPYRVVTIIDLQQILDKYKGESTYVTACKLLDAEKLIILRREVN